METFKKTLSGDSRYSISLTITEKPITSLNIANNDSDVDYLFTATKSSGSGYYDNDAENPIKITVDGEVIISKNTDYDFTGSTPKTITLASGTLKIKHDIDGTKTIQCSAYFKDKGNSLGSATASGSVQLTTLHKAPEPTITSIYEQDRYLRQLNLSNVFVANVSSKRFTLNANTYDSATIVGYKVSNGDYSVETQSQYATLNFKLYSLTIADNKVPITITAIDRLGGIGKNTIYFDDYIPYFKPTLVQSNLKAKRDGQRTGKVKLIANGTYYNGSVGSVSPTPKVYYAYREKGTQQYSNWLSATPTYSNGKWSIEENIGSDNPSDTNWFDPTLAYDVAIYVTDTLQEELTEQDNDVYETSVLIGEAIMTKYRNRIDIKRLDINGKPTAYYPNNIIQLGGTTSDTLFVSNGYISSSSKNLYFTLILPKKLIGITSITPLTIEIEARGVNGYLNNQSGYIDYIGPSGYSVSAKQVSENAITIVIKKSTAWTNVTNNTPIVLNGYFEFELS